MALKLLDFSELVRWSVRDSATALQLDIENCLIGLEDHAGVHLEVLIQVEPGAIGARLVIDAIDEPPGGLIRGELYVRLVLRQKLVIYTDITVGCPSNDNFLPREILLEVVDFTCGRPAKDFELQLD